MGLLVGLLALLLFGAGYWVLYTPAGTRWLLTNLPGWTSTELKIDRIEGTLAGRLQLEGIELQQPELRLSLDHLSWRNRLRSLFPLALDISQIRINEIDIQSSARPRENAPGEFHWPQTPWLLGVLQLALTDIEMREFSWRQLEQAPLQVELFSGNLLWQDGRLQGQQLQLQSADLQGRGSFRCGLDRPELSVTAEVEVTGSESPLRMLRVTAALQSGVGEQLLQGPVSLNFVGADKELLVARAELGLTPQQLQFRQLQLRRPNRSGKITANGQLRFSGAAPDLAAQLEFSKLDLQSETGQPLQLSGVMQLAGGMDSYRGQFEFASEGAALTVARLAGRFNGGPKQLSLTQLRGDWLSGLVSGQAQFGWEHGWQLQAELVGQGIDPQQAQPHLSGQLNFTLQTNISETDPGLRHGQLQLQLQESILHDQPLTGKILLELQGNALLVEQLLLSGEGMLLKGKGNLAERLEVSWQVERLEQLVEGLSGSFGGNGWLRLRQQQLATEFSASAEQLVFQQWRLGALSIKGKSSDAASRWQLRLVGEQLQALPMAQLIDRFSLELDGALDRHQLTLSTAMQQGLASASLLGGWQQQQWQGELSRFQVKESRIGEWQLQKSTPLLFSAQLVDIGPFWLRSQKGGELRLQGNYQLRSQQAEATLRWGNLDLSLLQAWLADWQVTGHSNGSIELQRGQRVRVHGRLSVVGELQHQQLKLRLAESEIRLDWDEQGLQGDLQLRLADAGSLNGHLTSTQIADFTWPKTGKLQLNGNDFPLEILQSWLPSDLKISGRLGLNAAGSWQIGQPLSVKGDVKTGEALFSWQDEDEILTAEISSGELNWQWHDRLQGLLVLQLGDHGDIESAFNLPLAADLPLAFASTEAVEGRLHARLQELGLLSIIFPERIQESRAQLKLDLHLDGLWGRPQLSGDFHLFDAEGFLPAAGIQLSGVKLQGLFAENHLTLKTLELKSGEGRLSGSGELELQNWYPTGYRILLKGERFQLLNLPEIQVRANPDLSIDGNREKIRIRGQVEFPDVLIRGQQKSSRATNSPDLVVVDREIPPPRQKKILRDIDLQLILGDRVLLDSAGIDAKLEGRVRLQSDSRQNLIASGEIQVAKGRYSSYGVSLDINRGALYFTGGPLDQPTLDILALRKSGEVQAGVKVSGTPKAPVVRLYSEPTMAETDILSYIVLGHPIGADRSQSGLLLTAAGALLSQGESVSLQEKLKGRLGLDVLDISSGDGDVNSSIITTGKYLSPDLYISLGYSLFSNSNEMKVRYNLTPVWEVESSIGIESGVDMFYRIELE